jgi:hypothetical protein
MAAAKRTLLQTFHHFLTAGAKAQLQLPRYLLLPVSMTLESTRFPIHADCRRVWADEQYSVFELTPR